MDEGTGKYRKTAYNNAMAIQARITWYINNARPFLRDDEIADLLKARAVLSGIERRLQW